MSKEANQTPPAENTTIAKNSGQAGGKWRPVAKISGHKDGQGESDGQGGCGSKSC